MQSTLGLSRQVGDTNAHPESFPRVVHCFSVLAAAEPGAMPRVLEYFAKRGLVPSRWVSYVTEPQGQTAELSIDIQIAGLEEQVAERIAVSLRGLHDVRLVLTSQKAAL